MNKAVKIIIAIVVVGVVAAGAVLLLNKSNPDETKNTNTATVDESMTASQVRETPPPPPPSTAAPSDTPEVTITYDGSNFSASATTMKAGGQVKVVNNSNKTLDFDSDPHPVHTDNAELNAGIINAGESKTFTITKTGTWGYHNHLNARQSGSITVQ